MSRAFGLLLLVCGLLATAFVTVEHRDHIEWRYYGVALAVSLFGALLVRLTAGARGSGMLILNIQIIRSSLTMLRAKLDNLDAERRSKIGIHGIHEFIDRHLVGDLDRFLAARETLIYKHGLETYGKVMDTFSAGERALRRAWSASVDGYADEVHTSLDRARAHFREALALVEEAER